jgi:xylulose-5-phosphate/fructose-6-phosphate phosphoketolase
MIYVSGPGHGAPSMLANAYLEGTYSEIDPEKSEDEEGLRRLFRAFSFPGGLGSHCTPQVPGSIHEGGELGYSLSHAFGAAFDNPDLIVAAVIGDGEAETGPLATSWHGNKFINPVRDGAVLPILHLNGYKIANPTVLARISRAELESLLAGYGYKPYLVEGSDPEGVHQLMASTLESVIAEIRQIQRKARTNGADLYPRWPMIVLRTPKGWTCPTEVDGHRVEDFWRAHQIPFEIHQNPDHLKLLEGWMRGYRPEELFDERGRLVSELKELAPTGSRRLSANPIANGGVARKPLMMPEFG